MAGAQQCVELLQMQLILSAAGRGMLSTNQGVATTCRHCWQQWRQPAAIMDCPQMLPEVSAVGWQAVTACQGVHRPPGDALPRSGCACAPARTPYMLPLSISSPYKQMKGKFPLTLYIEGGLEGRERKNIFGDWHPFTIGLYKSGGKDSCVLYYFSLIHALCNG